ncbi:MAG: hypothetical protein V4501_01640 [Pseudomonadota bacterium]
MRAHQILNDQPYVMSREQHFADNYNKPYSQKQYEEYETLAWCDYLRRKFLNIPMNNLEFNDEQKQAVTNLVIFGLKFCDSVQRVVSYNSKDTQMQITALLKNINDRHSVPMFFHVFVM